MVFNVKFHTSKTTKCTNSTKIKTFIATKVLRFLVQQKMSVSWTNCKVRRKIDPRRSSGSMNWTMFFLWLLWVYLFRDTAQKAMLRKPQYKGSSRTSNIQGFLLNPYHQPFMGVGMGFRYGKIVLVVCIVAGLNGMLLGFVKKDAGGQCWHNWLQILETIWKSLLQISIVKNCKENIEDCAWSCRQSRVIELDIFQLIIPFNIKCTLTVK